MNQKKKIERKLIWRVNLSKKLFNINKTNTHSFKSKQFIMQKSRQINNK